MVDERTKEVTISDVLDGIDNYFEIFAKLRKIDPEIYRYYSRVGAPLVSINHAIWSHDIERVKVPNASGLPANFGCFISRTKSEYRDEVILDKPSCLDFQYFIKLGSNHGVPASPGEVIYRHHQASLAQDVFSKEDKKKYLWARNSWAICWTLGISPDGTVRALPCRMNRDQILPSGDAVHHSSFKIPPGLNHWSKRGPDHAVMLMFNAMLAFTASALTGVQLTLRKLDLSVRFAIPIANVKSFFPDREKDDAGVRRQILHYVGPHFRYMADGRVVPVGEHLRGNRVFDWRGYHVVVSVPGIPRTRTPAANSLTPKPPIVPHVRP